MNKHTDTIIINGKHFNAKTGHALGAKANAPKTPVNVDGILPQHVTAAVLEKPAQYTKPMASAVKKPVMDIARAPAKHLQKRQTQPGQTLMRRAVAKPAPSLKRTTKILTANPNQATMTIANVKPKTSAAVIDNKKQTHASKIEKSSHINRFSAVAVTKYAASTPAYVQPEASDQAAILLAHTADNDIFERALAQANSHEQATPEHIYKSLKKGTRRKRFTNVAASSLAVLLITGFVGYQNLPDMKVQYAGRQAGFEAQLPNYRPSGFSVGKLSYQTGIVSVSYKSNSDSRAFAITQQPSAWDSQTLRENFVMTKDTAYRTATAAGRTIYVYGKNNATWVNGGVWYNVQTEGSLSDRQLTELATSL